MRQVHSVGLALTLIGLLGLTLPATAPTPTSAETYALALSAGSRLKLVTVSRPFAENRREEKAARTLSCGAVLHLGVADIGYRCGARPVLADAPRPVARAH